MSLAEAILALRRHTGQSQQIMSSRLGISLRAFQKYEHGQIPEPKQLLRLMAAAHALRRKDLYAVFAEALHAELDPPPGFQILVNVRIYRGEFPDFPPNPDLYDYVQKVKEK
jgi:transcriptional regulator with XRE-family HTH domain